MSANRYLMVLDPARRRVWARAAKRQRVTLAEWIRRACDAEALAQDARYALRKPK